MEEVQTAQDTEPSGSKINSGLDPQNPDEEDTRNKINIENGVAESTEKIKGHNDITTDKNVHSPQSMDGNVPDETKDGLGNKDDAFKDKVALDDENESNEIMERQKDQDGSELQNEASESGKTKKLSRSEKKRKRHGEVLQQRKEDRKRKKKERKQRFKPETPKWGTEGFKTRREQQEEIRLKCEAALQTGQKICIDCSLEEHMSAKEKGKLAMQVGRLYGSNKRSDSPAHIYITGLKTDRQLYKELVKKNDGFLKYLVNIEEKSHTELFPPDKIISLSPDSDTVLEDLEPDKIYVIGGLVDESITKNITASQAREAGIQTARLPIDEYMMKVDQPSHSKVLAVNQVFDILLNFMSTRCWKSALSSGVPVRKGFVVKEENS